MRVSPVPADKRDFKQLTGKHIVLWNNLYDLKYLKLIIHILKYKVS